MEQQLTKQVRLQRSIERTIENAKKVGKGNLTPAKLRSRINSLKDIWAQYQEGHDLLSRAVPSTTKASLDYFKDEHYDATEDAFNAASDFLADLLEELEPFTLLDKVNIAVASLTSLNRSPEQLWNDVLVHSVVSKLDSITRKAWNIRSSDAESPPSFDELSRFLHSRVRALEANIPTGPSKVPTKAFPTSKVHVATTAPNESSTCPLYIAKMYRQIQIDPRDINYQTIVWRASPSAPICEYHLFTVTYGMACAPFLALRVLKQLVDDEGADFPLAIPILRNNIYVDDLLFGADDANSLTQTRDQLVALLRRGGFQLRKWSSNSSALLADIDPTDHGLACSRILSTDDRVNILGVTWTPASNTLEFQVHTSTDIPSTKRSILSTIAKLYDPLGLVTPVTITAKIFMQELWRLKVGWDDTLPESMFEKWRKFYAKLPVLSGLTIKRWTGFTNDATQIELHGFADASASAYASVVYLKVTNSKQSIITLLTGKSKVAPLTALNIPRLELNAALLLVRLLEFVRESLDLASFPCYCWTDSTVVLAWIQQHPSRWKQFVANRVHEIQSRIPDAKWMHVSSNDNPADCASRGCSGDEIINMTLWWKGPSWLMKSQASWPIQKSLTSSDMSLEQRTVSLQCSPSSEPWDLASRYSSWPKLLRVTAYLFKFTDLCHQVNKTHPSEGFPRSALTPDECCRARTFWLKQIQADVFPLEIQALSRNQSIPAKSSLTPLQPMLDHHGLLRVDG
ncbi:uncharacterized protein LOC116849399 [Odontomachus brunneus]|uniref:uncharacterized protein LOC116849399 n=1 Tax=Odontomachus brunneus TaxID=486640 RepID=UPI0013F20446|nr:uncharacterized protein LOC116849399 [Odontomachus brunneus]